MRFWFVEAEVDIERGVTFDSLALHSTFQGSESQDSFGSDPAGQIESHDGKWIGR